MKGKATIAMVFLFSFLMGMHFISAVLYPFYIEWGNLPKETAITTVTTLQLWFVFCVTVFETPTGFVADKFGRKWSLALGAFTASVGWIVYTAVPEIWCFALGEAVLALAIALISGADTSLLFETCQQYGLNSQKAYSAKGIIAMVGMLIAAPIGSIIAVNFGARFAFLAESIPTAIAGLVILLSVEPKRTKNKDNYTDTVKKSINIIKDHKRLFLLTLNMTIVANLGLLGIWLYQPLLLSMQFDPAMFGITHGIMVGIEILVMLFWQPRLGTASEKAKIIYIGVTSLIPALGFIVAAQSGIASSVWLASIAVVGFGMSRRPFFERELNEHIGKGEESNTIRATTMSMLGMLRSGGQTAINLLAIAFAAKYLNGLLLWAGVFLLVFTIGWISLYVKVNGKH